MDSEQFVEMRPAFEWTCEHCGKDNFARAVVADFNAEEMQELRDLHGVQPWESGEFLMKPDRVCCAYCGQAYNTVEYEGGR